MTDLIEAKNKTIGRAVYLIEVLLDELLKANPDMRLSDIKKEAEEFCEQQNAAWHFYFTERLKEMSTRD